MADLPSQRQKDAHLTKFFKPYFSLLPHYEEVSEDCKPISLLATNWVNDDLAGNGSYSTFRTGLKEGDRDIEIMREGLPDRGLWFAGEHTAPFIALGTVTGAYWSGEAVGNRITEAYGMIATKPKKPCGAGDIVGTDGTKEINVRGFADKALQK